MTTINSTGNNPMAYMVWDDPVAAANVQLLATTQQSSESASLERRTADDERQQELAAQADAERAAANARFAAGVTQAGMLAVNAGIGMASAGMHAQAAVAETRADTANDTATRVLQRENETARAARGAEGARPEAASDVRPESLRGEARAEYNRARDVATTNAGSARLLNARAEQAQAGQKFIESGSSAANASLERLAAAHSDEARGHERQAERAKDRRDAAAESVSNANALANRSIDRADQALRSTSQASSARIALIRA